MRPISLTAAALVIGLSAVVPLGSANAMFFGCDSPGYLNARAHAHYVDLSSAKKKKKKTSPPKEEYLRIAPSR